jgi:hypothetical protein
MIDENQTPEADQNQPARAPKHRSPSYPAIDLRTAIARAATVQEIAGTHAAPVATVIQAWGYRPKTSGGLQTLAALKKFGLAEDEGKREARQLRLSTLGRELLFYRSNPESSDWKERIRKAALAPGIHAELWAKYAGNLPADQVIQYYLVFDRKFSEVAAKDLLSEFRRTLAYAGVDAQDGSDTTANVSDEEEHSDSEDESEQIMGPTALQEPETQPRAPPVGGGGGGERKPRTVQVPYSPSEWALVQARFPMTEAAWDQMIAVLNAMKPGLVAPPEG